MSGSSSVNGVPSEILLFFFRKAKVQLEKYIYDPSSTSLSYDGNENDDNDDDEYTPIPITLHQKYILEEQMTVLKDIVDDYNTVKKTSITVQNVQDSLRLLGSSTASSSSGDGGADDGSNSNNNNDDKKLEKAMKEMNDAARGAFCKSILCSEYYWYKQQKQKQLEQLEQGMTQKELQEQEQGQKQEQEEEGKETRIQYVLDLMMLDYHQVKRPLTKERNDDQDQDSEAHSNRQLTLEFCGLCTTAFKLPQVQKYIQSGKDLSFSDGNLDEVGDKDPDDLTTSNASTTESKVTSTSTPQQRVSHLQQMILCALGYEPYYGSQGIIQNKMAEVNSDIDDPELKETVTTFILLLQEITKDAMKYSLQEQSHTLTDEGEGGVTRVVAVNYSEREVSNYSAAGIEKSSSDAPMNQRMEEQGEEMQREQLQMAQRAAKLQQMILSELLSMEEEEREKSLLDAGAAHEKFLKDAMAVPLTERVTFMQNIDQDLQKKLLMYKLWQSQGEKR